MCVCRRRWQRCTGRCAAESHIHYCSGVQKGKTVYQGSKMSCHNMGEVSTYCSSAHLSCLHSRSDCHTSSDLGCSCYSHNGIHVVRRSFHLYHQKQTNMEMKTASNNMNIKCATLPIVFRMCNHSFLGVRLSKYDAKFKTQYVLRRLTQR